MADEREERCACRNREYNSGQGPCQSGAGADVEPTFGPGHEPDCREARYGGEGRPPDDDGDVVERPEPQFAYQQGTRQPVVALRERAEDDCGKHEHEESPRSLHLAQDGNVYGLRLREGFALRRRGWAEALLLHEKPKQHAKGRKPEPPTRKLRCSPKRPIVAPMMIPRKVP
ncbi:MAG: hypothetical protein CMQ24_10730 [Gammaproteobacteria bacterium]|nr:hypothetical protein [Gammaproteobacteria bacterium]